MTYTEILRENSVLKSQLSHVKKYSISILSNVIVAQQKEILEHTLRKNEINAAVDLGNYDNILQDSADIHSDAILVFWEAANLIEGLAYKAENFSEAQIQDILKKVKSELVSVFNNLGSASLVIINTFSSLPFTTGNLRVGAFERICKELNLFVESKAPSNFILADLDKLYARISLEKSIDWRYWYSSKALYTVDFFREYAEFVKPAFLSIMGKAKKALFLDCDNTLWKGVIGEDGMNGVILSSNVRGGSVYEEVQSRILSLAKKGIILGLATKNNSNDVEEIFVSHPEMILRNEHIAIKAINWEEKPDNVRKMVKDLNIGSDSCVFLDDSDFEVGYMKEQIPEVSVFQVPSKGYNYPGLFCEIERLFFATNISDEDKSRIEMYQIERKRMDEKSAFESVDEYLLSLDLGMTIYVDHDDLISRLAQMTQKTNQFNLTTKRYTDLDLRRFNDSPDFTVIAFGLKDKFGDSGITGLCILEFKNNLALIDSLLMSCRVLGRNAEKVFMDQVIKVIKDRGVNEVQADYFKTPKNVQVADFYSRMGFKTKSQEDLHSKYQLRSAEYNQNNINYIKIVYEK